MEVCDWSREEIAVCRISSRWHFVPIYMRLENSLRKYARWLVKNRVCITRGDTELARAVDVVMARAKRIYILIIKGNKLISSFSSRCFLKEIENMYSVFLSSYTNTRESLGELEKAVETLACAFPQ